MRTARGIQRVLSLVVPAAILGGAACDRITGPASLLVFATDGPQFGRHEAMQSGVPFTIVNRSSRVVYLQRCGNRVVTEVDRREGMQWVNYSGSACLAVYSSAPLALASGERHAGSQTIRQPGQYRLRIGVATAFVSRPDWGAASNAFAVR